MGIAYSKTEEGSSEDASALKTDDLKNDTEEQLKKLNFSYDILKYENRFFRRENKEMINKLKFLQQQTPNNEELFQTSDVNNFSIDDFVEIENGSHENVEALKTKCKYLSEVVNRSKFNMNLLTKQLHYILRTKFVECEKLRETIHGLKVKNELLSRELNRINAFRSSDEMGVEVQTRRRLIQVFSSCNSSKISTSEGIWDAEGCCLIPLRCKSPSNVTIKEIEI